jgi:hypothetical protein
METLDLQIIAARQEYNNGPDSYDLSSTISMARFLEVFKPSTYVKYAAQKFYDSVTPNLSNIRLVHISSSCQCYSTAFQSYVRLRGGVVNVLRQPKMRPFDSAYERERKNDA